MKSLAMLQATSVPMAFNLGIFLLFTLAVILLALTIFRIKSYAKREVCKFCKKVEARGRIEISRIKNPKIFILCPACAKKMLNTIEEVENLEKICNNCRSKTRISWKIPNLGFFCPSCTPDLIKKIEEIAKTE
jgi:hypothetical protein